MSFQKQLLIPERVLFNLGAKYAFRCIVKVHCSNSMSSRNPSALDVCSLHGAYFPLSLRHARNCFRTLTKNHPDIFSASTVNTLLSS